MFVHDSRGYIIFTTANSNDVLKTTAANLNDVLKTTAGNLNDVLKTTATTTTRAEYHDYIPTTIVNMHHTPIHL